MLAIVITLICYTIVMILNYFAFIYVDKISQLFGKSAMDALTRIMGMILMAIGIQMGIGGLEGIYTSFVK